MKVWTSFMEGFVGSFALAGAIVMAVVSVASAFLHDGQNPNGHRETASRQ
jgi:hypothetical protein